MDNMLLIDCCTGSGFEGMQLNESEAPSERGLVKCRGKFQEAEAINKNKRMYPYGVLDENVKRLQEALEERRLVGELDHPTDSIIHFADASHVITNLWWDGNVLMGEGEILNTPHGKVLKALINDGVKVGISSRGVGNGSTNEDGILVIGESYKLITFDAVADPSTFAAFQEKVIDANPAGKKRESVPPRQNLEGRGNDHIEAGITKNESCGIDMVNKEALIACLGGFVKSQSEKYMSRLG